MKRIITPFCSDFLTAYEQRTDFDACVSIGQTWLGSRASVINSLNKAQFTTLLAVLVPSVVYLN